MRITLGIGLALLLTGCGGSSQHEPDIAPVTPSAEATVATAARIAEAGACFERGPGDYIESIEREEGTRSFRVHVPTGYDGTSSLPLVFNFHGQGRTARQQDVYSGLLTVADEHDFFVVSPEGGLAQWNIVGVYAEDGIDDVGAVSEILDKVESEFCIDSQRVFATGHSNGAQMASQMACVMPERFAGIAPVSGIEYQDCAGPPIAVITFHGTDDFNVPYEPIPGNVAAWVSYNGCPEMPESERIGDSVVREAYFGCQGQPVVFYTIEGGGHTWPGAEDDSGGIGPTNHEIDASELIWDFFKNVRRD